MKLKLNWQLESPDYPDNEICITGDKTYLKVSYNKKLWHCEAFYKWTSTWNNTDDHNVVSSWSSTSREESINAVVYDLTVQQRNFPSHFRCHYFNLGEIV